MGSSLWFVVRFPQRGGKKSPPSTSRHRSVWAASKAATITMATCAMAARRSEWELQRRGWKSVKFMKCRKDRKEMEGIQWWSVVAELDFFDVGWRAFGRQLKKVSKVFLVMSMWRSIFGSVVGSLAMSEMQFGILSPTRRNMFSFTQDMDGIGWIWYL